MNNDIGSKAIASAPQARVFISYSRKDCDFADRLDEALKARDFAPLIDRTDICIFEDWWQRIQNLITQADKVIFILSPDSLSSATCKKEVDFAASRNKRFLPIHFRPVNTKMIPDALERIDFEFFDEGQFEENVDRLVEAIKIDIDWIRKNTEFGEQAHNWAVAQPRHRGLLLRSPLLEEAEHWIASRPRDAPMPTAETMAFIAESRRRASRQRDTNTMIMTIGLGVAVGFAVVFYRQQVKSSEALDLARRLANALVLDLGRDPRVLSLPQDLLRKIFDRAIAGYDEVIKLDDADPQTYNDRGNAYFAKASLDNDFADYGRAMTDFDAAIRLDPKFVFAYGSRCWTRVVINQQLDQALLDCGKVLNLQPESARAKARAFDNRGFANLKLGRLDDAISDFEHALEGDPTMASSFYGLGLAKLKSGDRDGAQVDIARAVAISPNVAEELARYGIK
jgi:tetratricopeptide (TPR) repeat protein